MTSRVPPQNLSKDWIHWLATAEPSDIVKHLQQSSGGVNTIVDRIKHRTALHYAYVQKIEKIEKLKI